MNMYTEDEFINLYESLNRFSYDPANVPCLIIQIYGNYRVIMSEFFVKMLNCKRKRDFKKSETGPMKFVYYGETVKDSTGKYERTYKYIKEEEFKEIFDVIFLLEFSRVPLFINDMPEIAQWRLRIGK